MEKTAINLGWRLAAATLIPFVVVSLYLVFSRWPSDKFTAFSDYAGLGISIFIGAAFIVKLPIHLHKRLLFLLAYIPIFGILLVYFSLVFVCSIFGACL